FRLGLEDCTFIFYVRMVYNIQYIIYKTIVSCTTVYKHFYLHLGACASCNLVWGSLLKLGQKPLSNVHKGKRYREIMRSNMNWKKNSIFQQDLILVLRFLSDFGRILRIDATTVFAAGDICDFDHHRFACVAGSMHTIFKEKTMTVYTFDVIDLGT
ncbi:hypothetical protein ACJX0J_017665, partial [Zea mays]